ncbi:hypothetical protein ScPMuIL_012866 [Solemya velum]
MKRIISMLIMQSVFVNILHFGVACKPTCSKNGKVCDANGKVYSNECKALRKGVTEVRECTCEEICHSKPRMPVCCPKVSETYFNQCEAKCNGLKKKHCHHFQSPVCGVDDRDYENICLAQKAGVEVACEGICPCPCDCPEDRVPVCTALNKVYDNYCLAQCAGEEVVCGGTCPCESCICITLFDPVCDVTGNTHSNACNAACLGIPVACNKACPCDDDVCICTEEYAPVCGSDGVTYGNACEAECEGITVNCPGPCPCLLL